MTGAVRAAALALLAAACAPDTPAGPHSTEPRPAATPVTAIPPSGGIIEPSGYATTLAAPPQPLPERPPEAPVPPSVDAPVDPRAMANPDEETMRIAEKLVARLRREERGNFVQAIIIRDPEPRFALHFRRDAAETLARHTNDPRFKTVEGGVPVEELQPAFERWGERFTRAGLTWSGGPQPHLGTLEFDLGLSKAQFDALARQHGWPDDARLRIRFAPEPSTAAAIGPVTTRYVRVFPRVRYAPGVVPAIASHGRVILRNGCFRVLGYRGEDRGLAVFARDAQLRLDEQRYLVVGAPGSERPLARIGEDGSWGYEGISGPIDPGLSVLRARCGDAPLIYVGVPQSSAHAAISHWTLDRYAERTGLSREQAWTRVRRCWAERHGEPRPLVPTPEPKPGVAFNVTECDRALGRVPEAPPPPPAPPVRR